VDYARRNTVDLVVLGTHGRTGVSRAVLGSVAEAVIRRARCRVLTVPATLPPAAVPPEDVEETTAFCAVCRAVSRDDLICETCRAKIRGEALERKLREERAGRR
jgi:Universal stress protein family